jgi:hypothetical protein
MVSEPVEAPGLEAPQEPEEPEADSAPVEEPGDVVEDAAPESAEDVEQPKALNEDTPEEEE